MNADLNLAEILYDTGEVRYRYSRHLAADGKRWIRHGLFRAYHKNGNLASEGHYQQGTEEGLWRDYHENGRIAAEGYYEGGQEVGAWKHWNDRGEIEA